MEDIDISPFAYGLLALSNPHSWSNDNTDTGGARLLTGKSVYVWPLVFNSYVEHLQSRKNLSFETDLRRIDGYIERHFSEFLEENPVDFTNAGSQYIKSKPGSFQAIRKNFGSAVKKTSIVDAEKNLTKELRDLESAGLLIDPFTVSTGTLLVAVLGAVPYSFTQRTQAGDEKYLKIRAMLWEFESLTSDEKREVRFHFFMEQAIAKLKKHARLLGEESSDDENDLSEI